MIARGAAESGHRRLWRRAFASTNRAACWSPRKIRSSPFSGTAATSRSRYKPEMPWEPKSGLFEADRGLLAPYELSGNVLPGEDAPGMAAREPARRQARHGRGRSRSVHRSGPRVPAVQARRTRSTSWSAGASTITRSISRRPKAAPSTSAFSTWPPPLGAEHVLFAPANSEVSRRAMSRDDWKWEYVLWLGLGQKIRRERVGPGHRPDPGVRAEMLDYAQSKNLKLVAYVYPVMAFEQNRDWLVGAGGKRANLGIYDFQDWLITALEGFLRHTGISGYSFDHTFLNLRRRQQVRAVVGLAARDGDAAARHPRYRDRWPPGVSELRPLDLARRQLSASDLHRRAARELRLVSRPEARPRLRRPRTLHRLSVSQLRVRAQRDRARLHHPPDRRAMTTPATCPPRTTDVDEMLLPFRQRDWDYLGWRYSLLSSIAVAGWNNVIDMIPARDPEEFRNFSDDDRQWFQHWIDWTDANKEYLRNARRFWASPRSARWTARRRSLRDRGFVFLFNPNGRRMEASFTLDDDIGLSAARQVRAARVVPAGGTARSGSRARASGRWATTFRARWTAGRRVVLEIEPAGAIGRARCCTTRPARRPWTAYAAALTGFAAKPARRRSCRSPRRRE